MTRHVRSVVICNAPGCDQDVISEDERRRPVMKLAAAAGWIRVRSNRERLDLCPAHKPEATS